MRENCNCPWLKCPSHDGKLCSNDAYEHICDNCDQVHYIGEILANGIHLCGPCIESAKTLLNKDICELMNVVVPSVPPELQPLSDAIHEFFMGRIGGHETWLDPIHDVQAVIGLIGCVMHHLSKGQSLVVESYLKRFISFKSAYRMAEEGSHV